MEWLIIADDLTGACDTGGAFAAGGLRTRVTLDAHAALPLAQALVATTESRHKTASEAGQAVKRLLAQVNPPESSRVYKKIDSTLRGQPAAELDAAMRALQVERALVCPAFPAQGRTIRESRVFVRGSLLEDTVFGAEAAGGKLPDLLDWFDCGQGSQALLLPVVRQGAGAVTDALTAQQSGVWVADAETEADLDILAQAAMNAGLRLLCGSAGLARALTRIEGQPASERWDGGETGPALVVAGSRNPAAVRQVQALERYGVEVLPLAVDELRIASHLTAAAEAASFHINAGRSLVLTVMHLRYMPGDETIIAGAMGRLAAQILETSAAEGVVLTGGDIAAAACRSLGCRVIDLEGEVLPGMVWGRLSGGSRPGLRVVTKAGGFGDDQALVQALQFLIPNDNKP